MRVVWRSVLVLVVFIGVGLLAEHAMMVHGLAGGGGVGVVRPTAWAAGLFAGAIAAVFTLFVVLWKR